MKIRLKFALILSGAFLVAMIAMSCIAYVILYGNAHQEITERARLMLQAADSMRVYTIGNIKPLIANDQGSTFHPETVPAFAAMSAFQLLRQTNPNYTYRETALNPTKPDDLPGEWERELILKFKDFPKLQELTNIHDSGTGERVLFIARPITVDKANCLDCHSTPDRAPASLIATYGSANGFGWKLHDVVGAQIVTVPTSVSIDRARSTFFVFLASLIGVGVLVLITLNFTLRLLVVKPITTLNSLCDKVSKGDFTAEDPTTTGNDEINSLGRSFIRMKISLQKALRMLKD